MEFVGIDFLIGISFLATNALNACLNEKVLKNTVDLDERRLLRFAAWALIPRGDH